MEQLRRIELIVLFYYRGYEELQIKDIDLYVEGMDYVVSYKKKLRQ